MHKSKQMFDILRCLTIKFDGVGPDVGTKVLHNWHIRDILRYYGLEVTPSREASYSRTMRRMQQEGYVTSRYRNFTHGKVFEITDEGIELLRQILNVGITLTYRVVSE